MVGIAFKPGFFAREFLEMPFGTLCATFLQALAQGMMPLACFLDSLTTECLTLAICCKVDDAKIDTERMTDFIGCACWNLQRDSQVEDTLTIDEVSLSFDCFHPSSLIVAYQEWDKHTTRERQEGCP